MGLRALSAGARRRARHRRRRRQGAASTFASARASGTRYGPRTAGWKALTTGAAYTVDDVALKYGACVDEETSDADVAYARFGPLEPTRYHEGWLR
jgi:hypothetical protein